MPQTIYVVDAFTDRPFHGNPAGVSILESPLADERMQQIALEMNHAETAFLTNDGEANYNLRWFTPAKEVKMCGHATLASAHILWTTGRETSRITFQTLSGQMTAEQDSDQIVLDFPAEFTEPVADLARFKEAFGTTPLYVGDKAMYWLVELGSETEVRNVIPDQTAIAKLGKEAVIITAKSDSEADDFVSRLFAPNVGIPEDPVTGSAHCILAPYWSKKLGKTEMLGYQASKRGGYVGVEFLGARVLLKGRAVTVLIAELAF